MVTTRATPSACETRSRKNTSSAGVEAEHGRRVLAPRWQGACARPIHGRHARAAADEQGRARRTSCRSKPLPRPVSSVQLCAGVEAGSWPAVPLAHDLVDDGQARLRPSRRRRWAAAGRSPAAAVLTKLPRAGRCPLCRPASTIRAAWRASAACVDATVNVCCFILALPPYAMPCGLLPHGVSECAGTRRTRLQPAKGVASPLGAGSRSGSIA